MQKITPEILRAWADGELSPEKHSEINILLAKDEELAIQAAAFEASKLPYKAAMNVDIPPVPAQLETQVLQWSRIADTTKQSAEAIKVPVGKVSGIKRLYRLALAASVLLFVISGLGAIWYKPVNRSVSDWTQAIVNYQNFYVAETVGHIVGDRTTAAKKLEQLKQRYPAFPGIPPELEELGYAFKRLQRLDFNNQPVLQMVFYKDGKRPLAICLMPEHQEAVVSQFSEHELLNSYVWQSKGLRAIVVAEEEASQLKAIAERVDAIDSKG
ncbi:MAG: anti-sigma factor family protein [Thiolinea sp.]